MKQITLTKNEVFDLIEDGVAELVKTIPWKWGSIEYYVFKKGEEYYQIKVPVHISNGWELEETNNIANKVKPVEKTIIEWRPVAL